MLSRVLFTVALATSTAMGLALPKEVAPQAVVASSGKYTLVSPDSTCGGTTGYTCLGSGFGDCCSSNGFCGSTSAFCGVGCFGPAGLCSSDNVVLPNTTPADKPKATHVPWKPTPHRDPHYKPSYVIDNGERAPNQVWS